ncbi:uncharacterized protein LOC119604880 isoform X2 [Lucilia sericata]|uniref:uncharacterized protein LOC119604880 isoform X2 n=1 Tax=Lucilia sericata TaxID=13632 RepID=UPI0018A85D54|nr:uncharacterized protein LOC119604880 isoform X2 [Lucilia sericata]
MFYNILLHLILIFYVWNSNNFVDAEIDPEYILACDEFPTLDFTRFESQLEALKTGNELLKIRMDKQDEFLLRLEEKIEKSTQSIEIRIQTQSKEYFDILNDLIGKQNQLIETQFQEILANDKIQMISDIKEIVKGHDVLLGVLNEKLNNMENILNKNISKLNS